MMRDWLEYLLWTVVVGIVAACLAYLWFIGHP